MEIFRNIIDQNRVKINQKLHETIRKTENNLFAIFFDSLRDEKVLRAQNLLEQLKTNDVNKVHTKLLELLRDFFEKNFYDIASNTELGWLYFNEPFKDLYWFDFIFDYVDTSHNNKEFDFYNKEKTDFVKKINKKDSKKEPKIFLPSDHRLVQEKNYKEYRKSIYEGVNDSLVYYTNQLWMDQNNKNLLKNFIEKYIIYVLQNTLFQQKLVLNIKGKKWVEILKIYIADVIEYIENNFDLFLDIDQKRIIKKNFNNTKTDEDWILEYSYENSLLEDVKKREEYFTTTYFLAQNLSAKDIYWQVMSEYSMQSWSIKSAHEFYSPDYFLYKNKKSRLEAELYSLGNQSDYENEYKEIIESINNEIKELENKIDNHFYAKIEKSDFVWKWKSLKEIMEKYMKYYKIPIQYWRMFFILINYYNHYNKMKVNIRKNADETNKLLEQQLFSASDVSVAINSYLHQYITFKKQDEFLVWKRNINYAKKIEKLRQKVSINPKIISQNPNIDNQQLTLEF